MRLFLTAASDISIGEALGNMVVGLGVVFLALLFLCGIISLFKVISKLDKSSAKAAPAKAPVKAAPAAAAPAKPAPEKAAGVDGAVVAVILAAVAEKCGPNARVTSIQKAN